MEGKKERFKLSYESDGKMGKNQKMKQHSEEGQRKEKEFFNTTQASE